MPRYPEHLRDFDYTGPSRYFLTMCTHERARHFVDGQHVALVRERLTGLFLWQRYGYERVLRNEEATPAVARDTIANPVRAGLVRSPADYPFWGSFVYTREALLEYIERAA